MLRHVVEGIGPGIRVSDFGNPVEALRWSEGNGADLLLLDYRMPEMDGLEFARRFRRSLSRRDVPIVLISVVGDEPVRQAALEAGVIDFLVKPVRPRELRSRCKNLLQMRQQGESVKERARSLEQRVLASMQEVEQRERETLFRLAKAIEYRDLGTGIHLLRMSHYAELIAEALGVPEEEARIAHAGRAAARYRQDRHPGCRAAQAQQPDRRGIRGHAPTPADRLRDPARQPEPLRADGRGRLRCGTMSAGTDRAIPMGSKAKTSRQAARIVAVADVFDALTSERPLQAGLERRRGLRLRAGESWHAF